ncbi:MAG: hypothetical protein WCF03_03185 [Nitrososphaeraceae archaeon]
MKNDSFVDEVSKRLYNQLPNQLPVLSHVMLNIEQFEIGSRYVTAKVQNRYGENVTINIQGGYAYVMLICNRSTVYTDR